MGRYRTRQLRVVLVARPDIIDPAKFGVTLAVNLGFILEIFETEAQAIAWLDRSGSPGAR